MVIMKWDINPNQQQLGNTLDQDYINKKYFNTFYSSFVLYRCLALGDELERFDAHPEHCNVACVRITLKLCSIYLSTTAL